MATVFPARLAPVGPRADRRSKPELSAWARECLREGREQGDDALQEARARVVIEYIWLARAVAGRYGHRGEDDEDLLQVACAGLVEAVSRFDPDRGDFLAFAAPTVIGLVKRHFRDCGWLIKPPRRTQELVVNLRREWSELAQELGHAPTDEQLGERLGEAVDDVAEARSASRAYRSVSADGLPDSHPRLADPDAGGEAQIEARLIIERVLATLEPDDRRLIWLRFFEGRSQSDIAAEIGTNQMQVSRRLSRLLDRLRQQIGTDDWPLAG